MEQQRIINYMRERKEINAVRGIRTTGKGCRPELSFVLPYPPKHALIKPD